MKVGTRPIGVLFIPRLRLGGLRSPTSESTSSEKLVPLVTGGALQPAYASRRAPEQYNAIVRWGMDKVNPSEGPSCLYEVSVLRQTRRHVYVRLYKPPFASANQNAAGPVSTNEKPALQRLCLELHKWIYIKKPLLAGYKLLSLTVAMFHVSR